MIDDALDSMASEGNSVNDADDNDVNGNDDSENQVQRKWPGLKSAHIMMQEEINSHNSYIDKLVATEIENEKREMLMYIDKLLDMTAKDIIKDIDLNCCLIVVCIKDDEFVNGEVLVNYISMKFMDEQGRYSFSQTQSHFVEICHNKECVCDVIRIKFLHSRTGK